MRVARMLMGAVAIAVLTGCSVDAPAPGGGGGGDGGGAGGGGGTENVESIPDPCTLVTKEEATAAVGAPVSDGQDDLISQPGMPTGRSCSFRAVTGGDGQLTITIWPVSDGLFETYRDYQKGFGDVEEVPGVGDAAFRVGWTGLDVLEGGYLLEFGIGLVKYDPGVAIENLTALAKSSTGRL